MTDGAAFCLLMTAEKAKAIGVKPIARLAYYAVAGCKAEEMGVGPAYAIPKVLKMAGLTTKDIDVYEINEAFASQALYSIRKIGIEDRYWQAISIPTAAPLPSVIPWDAPAPN